MKKILILLILAVAFSCTKSHLKWYNEEGFLMCPDTTIIKETENIKENSKTELTISDLLETSTQIELEGCDSVILNLNSKIGDLERVLTIKDGVLKETISKPKVIVRSEKKDTVWTERVIQVAADCAAQEKRLKEKDLLISEKDKTIKKLERKAKLILYLWGISILLLLILFIYIYIKK